MKAVEEDGITVAPLAPLTLSAQNEFDAGPPVTGTLPAT